jgi:hypothetical protein
MILCEWDAPEGDPAWTKLHTPVCSYPIDVFQLNFNFLCLLVLYSIYLNAYNTPLLGISDSLRHGLINYIDDNAFFAFLKHLPFYKMLRKTNLSFLG